MKRCTKCGLEKDESEFYHKGGGLTSRCKQCIKNDMRCYAVKNKDALSARRKQKYASDSAYREDLSRKQAEYNSVNKEVINERRRLRYATDPKVKATRVAYLDKNKAKINSATRESRHRRMLESDETKAKFMVARAKARARSKGICHDIVPGDLLPLPTTCPVLGLVLKKVGKDKDPNLMSMDRFEPSLGYTKGNVFVISARANDLKKNATIEELELVLAYMKRHAAQQEQQQQEQQQQEQQQEAEPSNT